MPAVLLAPQFLFAQATLSLIKKSQWSDYLKALLPPSAPRRAFTAAQKGQSFFIFFAILIPSPIGPLVYVAPVVSGIQFCNFRLSYSLFSQYFLPFD